MSQRDKVLQYFEFLESKGLGLKRAGKTVMHWTPTQVLDFLIDNQLAFPHVTRSDWGEPNVFDLAASASLAGGLWPCASSECRLRRADELCRFAALYADRIMVPSLFPFELPDGVSNFLRMHILNDLLVLELFKPLLEAEIIGFTPRYYTFCANHVKEFKTLEKRLENAANTIVSSNLKTINLSFKRLSHSYTQIAFKGPEKFFDHSQTWLSIPTPISKLKRHSKKSHVLAYLNPILEDVLNQQILNASGYISDRELDFELIELLSKPEIRKINQAVFSSLSHSLPFVRDVPLSVLLRLRNAETESFKVYRDSLKEVITSVNPADPEKAKELFDDRIAPELNSIDLAIKNSRTLLKESIATDLIVSAAFLGIGLFSGWIPPRISEILTAVGGYKFASTILKELRTALREPEEVMNNKFYFLWKVKQAANGA